MDGPNQLGHRTLVIEFQIDRHVQDRIELAYRRIETLAINKAQLEDSVQVDLVEILDEAALLTETHG